MHIRQLINRKNAEAFLLVIFIFFVLFVRIGQPWGHKISHSYPTYFNANDNFLHAEFSDYVKEKGNYAYSPYYMYSGYEDVIGYLPPILYHLSAMLSHLTDLETYDTTYIIVMFLTCFGYLLVYFAIKRVNETLAILSLPFMLGIFSFSFEIAHAWGLHIFITGSFFVFALIWCMENFDKKYSFILLSLFLSGAALGHTSELIFGVGFIAVILVLKFFRNELKKSEIKNIILGFLIFAVISAYYLTIFYFTWMKTQPFSFSIIERPGFAPNFGVNIWDFGITQFLLYAGLLFFVFLILFKDDAEKINVKSTSPVLIAGIFMLLIGYTNYIGFNIRAFQTRIFWPVYLAVFMGLGLYFIPAHFKKWKFRYAYILSFLLVLIFFFNHYNTLLGPGLIDQEIWNGFKWISENTPEEAKVYHFYSDFATQLYAFFPTKRISYVIDVTDYIEALKAGVIKAEYKSVNTALTDTQIPYRTSLFSYGYHAYEDDFKKKSENVSLWDMDYYFFVVKDPYDKNTIPYIYNNYVKDFLKNQTWIEEVYSNSEVVILKNNEPGRKPYET
jgi:hypothetical protein